MNPDLLTPWFQTLLSRFLFLIAVVALDLIGGMILAAKQKRFDFEQVPKFLKGFAPYFYIWIAMEILEILPAVLGITVSGFAEFVSKGAGTAAFAFVLLKYVASVMQNIDAFRKTDLPMVGAAAGGLTYPTSAVDLTVKGDESKTQGSG